VEILKEMSKIIWLFKIYIQTPINGDRSPIFFGKMSLECTGRHRDTTMQFVSWTASWAHYELIKLLVFVLSAV
jgi:hypothetical protein